jgi:hypothetical protein
MVTVYGDVFCEGFEHGRDVLLCRVIIIRKRERINVGMTVGGKICCTSGNLPSEKDIRREVCGGNQWIHMQEGKFKHTLPHAPSPTATSFLRRGIC